MADSVDSGGEVEAADELVDSLSEEISEPIKKEPVWMPGEKPHGFEEIVQERMQSRLAALKAQFEALNDTEKAEIEERAMEMREKMAMMMKSPPPMMCPPPEECDCEDEEEEEDEEEDFHPPQYPQPWWMSPPHQNAHHYPHHQFQQGQNYQFQHGHNSRYSPGYIQPMHGPMEPTDSAENYSQASSEEEPHHKAKRDLARLRKTFSVTNPTEWWQDIDFGRGNAVSDSIASWNLGAATQHSISSAMDHYSPALHIGTINRGSIMHPAMGGPADRIFGYNPDFNRQDHHAFKFKPRGQFQKFQNKPLDYFQKMKYLPAGAEFYYNPNPQLRPALTGVSVNPNDNNVYSDKYLSQDPGQTLPRGSYKLKWIQLVPTADKTKVQGFNMVLKNSQTGQHFRLDNADVNQFQGSSPYRQQFNRVGHQWGGGGLAQGPAGSVYDTNLPGYRIESGQNYLNNYYGTPHYYNRWSSQLPSKI